MFKKIVPLQTEKHADLKLKAIRTFDFAADIHIASVLAHEFLRAASTYPIVFVEDQASDMFRPMALLGLNPQENLFVNEEGKWEATYVPAILRRYPFAMAKSGQSDDDDRFTVCIDEESEFFSETEGQPLFTAEGEPGQLLENVQKFLATLYQMDQFTQQFCQQLKENNMFAPVNMRIRHEGKAQSMTGAYAINEQRLKALKDDTFLQWREKNYLSLIYCQLTSLMQVERLVQMRDKNMAKQKDLSTEMMDGEAPPSIH